MSAAKKDVIIDQGADWFITFTYKDGDNNPINLTGYTSNMQLRQHYDSATPVLSLTSSSGMTITPLLGKIDVRATASQTGSIAGGEYVYDLEITAANGVITRLVYGRATVRPQVTR